VQSSVYGKNTRCCVYSVPSAKEGCIVEDEGKKSLFCIYSGGREMMVNHG